MTMQSEFERGKAAFGVQFLPHDSFPAVQVHATGKSIPF